MTEQELEVRKNDYIRMLADVREADPDNQGQIKWTLEQIWICEAMLDQEHKEY